MIQRYVLGFAFDLKLKKVVLIQKARPEWMVGKLNGVGGKIEEDEDSIEAMIREFHEETGVLTDEKEWNYMGVMYGNDYAVECYTMRGDISAVQTKEAEPVDIYKFPLPKAAGETLPNLAFLLPLAADYFREPKEFKLHENASHVR